ncbi:Clotting factor B [Eumeta japonica]|uniref:Clotting factor B n=1 Tax=Eumeta variegata TaxID=151549 RepID=A0A4C1X9R7_EUMVA|nr:Clotting factor B [Eumeta japonica]
MQICYFKGLEPVVCCFDDAPSAATPIPPGAAAVTTEKDPVSYDYEYTNNNEPSDGCEPIPARLTSARTGSKAWDKCIEYQHKYVYPCEKRLALGDGKERMNYCGHDPDELHAGGIIKAGQFPHMVLLGFGNDTRTTRWLCGGTIISEKFVLSAGRCFKILQSSEEVKYIRTAMLKRSELLDPKRIYRVARILVHPEYHPPKKYNDIGLLESHTEMLLDRFAMPACLPVSDTYNGTRALAIGFGPLGHPEKVANSLRKRNQVVSEIVTCLGQVLECGELDLVKLYSKDLPCAEERQLAAGVRREGHTGTRPRNHQDHIRSRHRAYRAICCKFSTEDCSKMYPPTPLFEKGFQESSQLCYGDKTKARDTCQGNTGGPLQIANEHVHCMYTIIGIISYGIRCGIVGMPWIYTRVVNYVPWIESTTDEPPVSLNEVQTLLKSLKTKKAPGLDATSNKAIKCCSMPRLVAICNACLRNFYFSPVWKEVEVIGIYKPGETSRLPYQLQTDQTSKRSGFGQRSRKKRKRVSLLPDDNLYQDGSDTERVRMTMNTKMLVIVRNDQCRSKDLPVHSLRCSNNPHCTKHILHYPIADVIDHELITNFIVVKANWIRDDANDTTLVNPAPLQKNFRHRGVINALPNDLTGR